MEDCHLFLGMVGNRDYVMFVTDMFRSKDMPEGDISTFSSQPLTTSTPSRMMDSIDTEDLNCNTSDINTAFDLNNTSMSSLQKSKSQVLCAETGTSAKDTEIDISQIAKKHKCGKHRHRKRRIKTEKFYRHYPKAFINSMQSAARWKQHKRKIETVKKVKDHLDVKRMMRSKAVCKYAEKCAAQKKRDMSLSSQGDIEQSANKDSEEASTVGYSDNSQCPDDPDDITDDVVDSHNGIAPDQDVSQRQNFEEAIEDTGENKSQDETDPTPLRRDDVDTSGQDDNSLQMQSEQEKSQDVIQEKPKVNGSSTANGTENAEGILSTENAVKKSTSGIKNMKETAFIKGGRKSLERKVT